MDESFSASAQAAGDSEVDFVVDVEDVPEDSVEPPEDSVEPPEDSVDPLEESVEPPEDSPDEEEFDDVSLDVELDPSEERLSFR